MIKLVEQERVISLDKALFLKEIHSFASSRDSEVIELDEGSFRIWLPATRFFSADSSISISLKSSDSALVIQYYLFTSKESATKYFCFCILAAAFVLLGDVMQTNLMKTLGLHLGTVISLVPYFSGILIFVNSMNWISGKGIKDHAAFWESVDEDSISRIVYEKKHSVKLLLAGFFSTLAPILLLKLDVFIYFSGSAAQSLLLFIGPILLQISLLSYMVLKSPYQPFLSNSFILGGLSVQYTIIGIAGIFHIFNEVSNNFETGSEFLTYIIIITAVIYALLGLFIYYISQIEHTQLGTGPKDTFFVPTSEISTQNIEQIKNISFRAMLITIWIISSSLMLFALITMASSSMGLLDTALTLESNEPDLTFWFSYFTTQLLLLCWLPFWAFIICTIISAIVSVEHKRAKLEGVDLTSGYNENPSKAKSLLHFVRNAASLLEITPPTVVINSNQDHVATPEAIIPNAFRRTGFVVVPKSWYDGLSNADLQMIVAHELHHLKHDSFLLAHSLLFSMLTLFGRHFLAAIFNFSQSEYFADETAVRLTNPKQVISTITKVKYIHAYIPYADVTSSFTKSEPSEGTNSALQGKLKRVYETLFGQYIPAYLRPSPDDRILNIRHKFDIG